MGLYLNMIPVFAGDDTTDADKNDFLIVRGKITTVIYVPSQDEIVDDGYYF